MKVREIKNLAPDLWEKLEIAFEKDKVSFGALHNQSLMTLWGNDNFDLLYGTVKHIHNSRINSTNTFPILDRIKLTLF